ncbi:MAG TPA: tetratricopeptide repeat protein, partial [Burkholderiales bacterium]|nr:tetratricopeptide repeat protein [Burkholderiales bacterium]
MTRGATGSGSQGARGAAGTQDALEPFRALMAQADTRIELARASLMLARDAYPELDMAHYLGQIERFSLRLRAQAADCAVEDKVIALNAFMFGELGFEGNVGAYYDPRNSYLNEVIDRRTGIPISLSIVYMELGRRIGLPLEGVSFPGHFLVRLRLRGGMLVLDPFSGGAPQSEDDLRERLARVVPKGATGGIPIEALPLEQFLEPASHRQILARVLRNLKSIYRDADEPAQLLKVLNRILIVTPEAGAELRDRGLIYQRLECWQPALADLSAYLEREPEAADSEEMRLQLLALRAQCARM